MMETYISDFHTSFYVPEIQKLVFHHPHVRIIGTAHYGNTHRKSSKLSRSYQDLLHHSYYDERVVAIFAHQIQS